MTAWVLLGRSARDALTDLEYFLESDVNGAAHAAEELDQRAGLGGQNASGDDTPALFADCSDGLA